MMISVMPQMEAQMNARAANVKNLSMPKDKKKVTMSPSEIMKLRRLRKAKDRANFSRKLTIQEARGGAEMMVKNIADVDLKEQQRRLTKEADVQFALAMREIEHEDEGFDEWFGESKEEEGKEKKEGKEEENQLVNLGEAYQKELEQLEWMEELELELSICEMSLSDSNYENMKNDIEKDFEDDFSISSSEIESE